MCLFRSAESCFFRWLCQASDFSDAGFYYADLGNISIYTNETFFLTRTWQGKSVLANLILLVELWLMLELCAREKNKERQEETDRS